MTEVKPGALLPIGQLKIGDVFSFVPVSYEADAPFTAERLRCTGIIPVNARNVRRRAGLRGDQYSVYYKPQHGGPETAPASQRVAWNAQVMLYAPAEL